MTIAWTHEPEANRLLETDPLALLIGMVLDQQVPMEKAFAGPYVLKQRLGHLDCRRIAEADPEEIEAAFRQKPALHRFPASMARRVQELCRHLAEHYGCRADRVWKEAATGDELASRISGLPGFGEEKTRILISVLARKFGVRPPGYERRQADWQTIADIGEEGVTIDEVRLEKRRRKLGGPA